jgi:hypothetical protein
MRSSSELPYFLAAMIAVCCLSGCNQQMAPEASVKLKKGSSVRVVSAGGSDWTAKFGDKPAAVFPLEKGEAVYQLVPPKTDTLFLSGQGNKKSIPLALESEGGYTFLCVPEAGSIAVHRIDSKPTKSLTDTQYQVFNFADKEAMLEIGGESETVAAGSTGNVKSAKSLSLTIKGKIGDQALTPLTTDLRSETTYHVFVYTSGGKPKVGLINTNPPTRAAGMSQ